MTKLQLRCPPVRRTIVRLQATRPSECLYVTYLLVYEVYAQKQSAPGMYAYTCWWHAIGGRLCIRAEVWADGYRWMCMDNVNRLGNWHEARHRIRSVTSRASLPHCHCYLQFDGLTVSQSLNIPIRINCFLLLLVP